jgi:hypothetical protein
MASTLPSLTFASVHQRARSGRPGALFRLAVAVVLPALQILSAHPQDQRGFEQITSPAQADYANGNYYALVIGIDKYPPPMKELKTAVNDAKAVAKLLTEGYGFQVKFLLDSDASRSNILNSINQYRTTLKENDSLLTYYAGHGFTDREADKAYWLPADADSGILLGDMYM